MLVVATCSTKIIDGTTQRAKLSLGEYLQHQLFRWHMNITKIVDGDYTERKTPQPRTQQHRLVRWSLRITTEIVSGPRNRAPRTLLEARPK